MTGGGGGRSQKFARGGLIFFLSRRAQHPLGPENPLKSIDFTGPGRGGSAPIEPPDYASGKGGSTPIEPPDYASGRGGGRLVIAPCITSFWTN